MAPTIDTVALELVKLKEEYDEEFGNSTGLPLAATCTEQLPCSSAAGRQEERETSVTGDVLVERDADLKQRISDIINGDVNKRDGKTILPIFGPPWVGKTRLVKSVLNDDDAIERGEYYCKVWVDLRKGWGIEEIEEYIFAEYSKFINEGHSGYHMILVLDNLEEQDRSMLDKLLQNLQAYQRYWIWIIIMITRSEDLARYIARSRKIAGHRRHPCREYRLHPCSAEMCLEIIKQTSGLDLRATAADGREIATKCSGRPLAAKALGRFLQSVDPKEWPGLIRDVWNTGGGFSRYSLPTHSATVFAHLKSVINLGTESWLSLAYCAFFLFPKGKGHGVVTRDLLNQWCSLGITTLERGMSCISELLGHSLLLSEKNASTEAATLLTMEDLMHDFTRYLLGDRLIVVDGTNGATTSTSSPLNDKSSSSYLALVRNFGVWQKLDISSILPAGILALRFERCRGMELISDGVFESFGKYLRLLDLSGYSEMLPDFIRHLKQLRYLKAPRIQYQVLPRSITGLHKLNYLILHKSQQLQELTEAFQMLNNLLHLDLSGCSGLKSLPDSFGRLWRLEHLDLSACSGIEALPESFGWLRHLSHLDLSRCSWLKALPESFGKLGSLWHLNMSDCSQLKALPKSFGKLGSLWHLDMSDCWALEALHESFGGLSKLCHLDLSDCFGLRLDTSFQHLTELRHLDLSRTCLLMLQRLPMVSLPRELRHLNLSGCLELQGLPTAPEASKLRHLDLSGCSSLVGLPESYAELPELVHLNLSDCSSLIELNPDGEKWEKWASMNLEHLDLSGCSQLRYVPDGHDLPMLQYLDMSGCSSLGGDKISSWVEEVRRRGGRASGPQDASLREQGTSGTTN